MIEQLESTQGWAIPRMVAVGLRESADLAVYRATEYAIRDAQLSARAFAASGGGIGYKDFSLLASRRAWVA